MAVPKSMRASTVGISTEKGQQGEVEASLRPEIGLLFAQMESGKTDKVNEVFEVSESVNYEDTFGNGSIINRAKKSFFLKNPFGTLYVGALSGDLTGGAKATDTLTITEETASAGNISAITLAIGCAGKAVSVAIPKGSSPTSIATAIATAINADSSLLFSASSNLGVVTCTANMEGKIGNELLLIIKDSSGFDISNDKHGITIVDAGFSDGAGVADATLAIANIPDSIGFTRIGCQDYSAGNADALEAFGTDRRSVEKAERIIAYTGILVDSTSNTTIASEKTRLEVISDGRILDETNSFFPYGGIGISFDGVVDFISQRMLETSSKPGIPAVSKFSNSQYNTARTEYWFSLIQRDAMLKKGIANISLNGTLYQADGICVCYHPADDNVEGTSQPINFYDTDITSIGNINYGVMEEFTNNRRGKKYLEDGDLSTEDFVSSLDELDLVLDGFIEQWVGHGFIRDTEYGQANKTIDFSEDNTEAIELDLNNKLARTGRIYDFRFKFTK